MRKSFPRIRIVYRRTPLAVKALVLIMLVFCTSTLMVLRLSLMQTKNQLNDMRVEAQVLKQENDRLQKSISQLGTVQSVTELAKEFLGLVDPDTIIFEVEQSVEK